MPRTEVTKPKREIPINDQIATIKRRLLQIENKYPRLVHEHRITQERADNEIDRYRAVLETLIRAKDQLNERALRTFTESAPYDARAGAANPKARPGEWVKV